MTAKDFIAASTELTQGSYLIEASAGTGKTYTITMLVLRFIVEQGVAIDKLLVVTYTRAATADLKERVRLRLLEGRQALAGQTQGLDSNVVEWADNLQQDKRQAQLRIKQALLDIDQASIFTIHGFCQHALKEFCLECGQLFDSELIGDVSQLRLQIAEDYWREKVYLQPLWVVSILLQALPSPQQLLKNIDSIGIHEVVYPEPESLDVVLQAIEQNLESARKVLPVLVKILLASPQQSFFKNNYLAKLGKYNQNLNDWLQDPCSPLPKATLRNFTEAGIKAGLNGQQFRQKDGVSGDQRKQDYLQTLALDTAVFDYLQSVIPNISLIFRRNLIERLHVSLDKKLQQLNQLSFDSLIFRLSEGLQDENNQLLKTGLQQRYQVALIDEFQDTDQAQWHIFSTLFTNSDHTLYLIGDPKQAIYKFRGADIFSYFAASQSAQYHYSLARNWRSHPELVNAVNQLFIDRERPFWLPQLQFQKSRPGLTANAGEVCKANKPLAPMVLWQLAKSEATSGYWGITKAASEIRIAVVNEIVKLLDQQQGVVITINTKTQQLQPQDIAIVVRTNSQAYDYQVQLRNAGVLSVLNNTKSVFSSNEAKELYHLLQAIAEPLNLNLLKQALTLSWFNLDGQALYAIINDEQKLEQWLTRIQGYHQLWQRQGLLVMMYQVLMVEKVEVNLANNLAAERKLTNIHHLIELLQQAVVDAHLGLQKTLEWLQMAINEDNLSDEKLLRLESDEQAVNIITMHRCKGLEYPVVFCPTLWHRSTRLAREKSQVRCYENNTMITDIGSGKFKQRQELALAEELSEDLRLLYVAVTRAQYRCYLAWADVRSKNVANNSALAYLLFSDKVDGWQASLVDAGFSQQQQRLQNLVNQHPASFSYRQLAVNQEINRYHHLADNDSVLSAQQRRRRLSSIWGMTSYTALSALSIEEIVEIPIDKAQESTAKTLPLESTQEAIPKGAHTGNVIHELLENIDFIRLAKGEDIAIARKQSCLRYGLVLEQPDLIDSLLSNVVLTPLSTSDPEFFLANLAVEQCLMELPFFYAFDAINSADINAILAKCPDYKPLSGRQMQGFLTGFIDLICQYRGKYYVMDYKTNSLKDYCPNSMTAAMREHNYGLQYWIYSLVLHQYLKQRLPDYNYQHHFGGVRYLFVRGMQLNLAESGVYTVMPDLITLERLAVFFSNE